MNLTYSIDKESRIVYLKYTGDPDFDEWANTMLSAFRDPDFEPGFSFIMDRTLVQTSPSIDYIKKVVAFSKKHPVELGNCRTAIVVNGKGPYGMARMSQAYLEDTEYTRVFTDIKQAERWLRFNKK
jgi:hypothetical protein